MDGINIPYSKAIFDLIQEIFGEFIDLFSKLGIHLPPADFQFIATIIMAAIVFLWRIVMANLLQVKRHDKIDWYVWGVVAVLQIIAFFIKPIEIWGVLEVLILTFMIVWVLFFDKARRIKHIIRSSSVIFKDASDGVTEAKNDQSSIKRMVRERDDKIARKFSHHMMHLKLGVPVFMTKFVFKYNPMTTEEALARTLKNVSRDLKEYRWMGAKTDDGIKYEIQGELAQKTNLIVKFDSEVSSELDWFVVPLGSSDITTAKNAKQTPYVWCMHDPRAEGKAYKALEKVNVPSASPHMFIAGSTGGGKSSLVNTIIAHFINKAKTHGQSKLYLVDPKKVEFKPYSALEEIEGIAFSLREAEALTTEFCQEMHRRGDIMAAENMKSVPLDGRVSLKKSVSVNGHIFENKEIVTYKDKEGVTRQCRAKSLLDIKDDVAEILIPEKEVEKEDESNHRDMFF